MTTKYKPVQHHFDQMASMAEQHNRELGESKGEIGELKRLISRLQNETHSVKTQNERLQMSGNI